MPRSRQQQRAMLATMAVSGVTAAHGTPSSTLSTAAASQPNCDLVAGFVARQMIILVAGLMFLLYTWVRVKQGVERRDLRTFVADVSKQAGQQAFGGVLMVVVGVFLAEGSLDPLAWYGAEYPFEIVLTTLATSWLRKGSERVFQIWHEQTRWSCLEPYTRFGQYGPAPGVFLLSWYAAQMVQAVLIIGVTARLFSVACIVGSLSVLPEWSALRPAQQLAPRRSPSPCRPTASWGAGQSSTGLHRPPQASAAALIRPPWLGRPG